MSTDADAVQDTRQDSGIVPPSQDDGLVTQLTGLKRRRGGNIGYLKKIIIEIEKHTRNVDAVESDAEVNLLASKDILVEKEQVLKDYHEQIMSMLDKDEEITAEIEHHNDFIKEIRKSLHLINKYLSQKEDDKFRRDLNPAFHPSSTRLPKLHLKSFDGNSLAFRQFWDTFKSTIHNNHSIRPPRHKYGEKIMNL